MAFCSDKWHFDWRETLFFSYFVEFFFIINIIDKNLITDQKILQLSVSETFDIIWEVNIFPITKSSQIKPKRF